MSAAGRRIRLAAAIVRELRAGGHEHLVADVARWESDVAGVCEARS